MALQFSRIQTVMIRKSIKTQITETVLAQLPSDRNNYGDMTVDMVESLWWTTRRQERGLRLTDEGYFSFRLANLECYEYPLPKSSGESGYKLIMELNKKLQCPYFLGAKNSAKEPYIKVYDAEIAMSISLYGGIIEYLESVQTR